MTAIHRDPATISAGELALTALRDLTPSLVFAAVVTDDGFELAHVPTSVIDSGRFGSMSSSVQALSEAVSRELRIGSSEYVIIAAQGGHVVQLRIPDQPLILAALFDKRETLGTALSASRRCALTLTAALADLHTP